MKKLSSPNEGTEGDLNNTGWGCKHARSACTDQAHVCNHRTRTRQSARCASPPTRSGWLTWASRLLASRALPGSGAAWLLPGLVPVPAHAWRTPSRGRARARRSAASAAAAPRPRAARAGACARRAARPNRRRHLPHAARVGRPQTKGARARVGTAPSCGTHELCLTRRACQGRPGASRMLRSGAVRTQPAQARQRFEQHPLYNFNDDLQWPQRLTAAVGRLRTMSQAALLQRLHKLTNLDKLRSFIQARPRSHALTSHASQAAETTSLGCPALRRPFLA